MLAYCTVKCICNNENCVLTSWNQFILFSKGSNIESCVPFFTVTANFKPAVFHPDKDVFIVFYAPWSGKYCSVYCISTLYQHLRMYFSVHWHGNAIISRILTFSCQGTEKSIIPCRFERAPAPTSWSFSFHPRAMSLCMAQRLNSWTFILGIESTLEAWGRL